MKRFLLIVFILAYGIVVKAQSCEGAFIRKDQIVPGEDSRAGSCASSDGSFIGPDLAAYPPSYLYLLDSGYCYTYTPKKKNATVCYEFTAPGANLDVNAGYDASTCIGVTFSNFNLYTCAPACVLVGTGITFTGLTPGSCYTWCVDIKCLGGGPTAGFLTFCPYVVYAIPLPIELSSFSCFHYNNTIILNWSTASEEDSRFFEIERSPDGVNFEMIGLVDAAGNSTSDKYYNFQDTQPFEQNYYRLKQVNGDFSYSLSDIITCNIDETIISINYYNMLGQIIEYNAAVNGIYVKETITSVRKTRELVYKKN